MQTPKPALRAAAVYPYMAQADRAAESREGGWSPGSQAATTAPEPSVAAAVLARTEPLGGGAASPASISRQRWRLPGNGQPSLKLALTRSSGCRDVGMTLPTPTSGGVDSIWIEKLRRLDRRIIASQRRALAGTSQLGDTAREHRALLRAITGATRSVVAQSHFRSTIEQDPAEQIRRSSSAKGDAVRCLTVG